MDADVAGVNRVGETGEQAPRGAGLSEIGIPRRSFLSAAAAVCANPTSVLNPTMLSSAAGSALEPVSAALSLDASSLLSQLAGIHQDVTRTLAHRIDNSARDGSLTGSTSLVELFWGFVEDEADSYLGYQRRVAGTVQCMEERGVHDEARSWIEVALTQLSQYGKKLSSDIAGDVRRFLEDPSNAQHYEQPLSRTLPNWRDFIDGENYESRFNSLGQPNEFGEEMYYVETAVAAGIGKGASHPAYQAYTAKVEALAAQSGGSISPSQAAGIADKILHISSPWASRKEGSRLSTAGDIPGRAHQHFLDLEQFVTELLYKKRHTALNDLSPKQFNDLLAGLTEKIGKELAPLAGRLMTKHFRQYTEQPSEMRARTERQLQQIQPSVEDYWPKNRGNDFY